MQPQICYYYCSLNWKMTAFKSFICQFLGKCETFTEKSVDLVDQ